MQTVAGKQDAPTAKSASKTSPFFGADKGMPFFQPKLADANQQNEAELTLVPTPSLSQESSAMKQDVIQNKEVQREAKAPEEEKEEVQREAKAPEEEKEEVQREAKAPEEEKEEVQREAKAPEEEKEEVQREAKAPEEENEEVQREAQAPEEDEKEQVQREIKTPDQEQSRSESAGVGFGEGLLKGDAEITFAKPQVSTSIGEVNAAPASQSNVIQPRLKVGEPDGHLEREADEMAEKVQRMPQKQWAMPDGQITPPTLQRQEEDDGEGMPEIQGKLVQRAPDLQRSSDGALSTSSQFASRLQTSSGGAPLPAATQQRMENAFGADFGTVRIHTNTEAAQLSDSIGARAFTYRNNIYFNDGQYNPGTQDGEFLLAHELTHTVQQGAAVRRTADLSSVSEPAIQRIPFGETLNEYAHYIPGYSLFTVIIGYNPLTERSVPRNAVNLVQGLLELIPVFGVLLFNELNSRGILQQAFDWAQNQLRDLGLTRSRLEDLLNEAVGFLTNPFTAAANIERLFSSLYQSVVRFVNTLKDALIQMLKDALLSVLKALAIERLPAYRLLTKILHHDPITGEDVPATTVEILEDFLRLINANDELEQMRERGTLQRTADWIDTQVNQFLSLLEQLGGIFQRIWALFSIETLSNLQAKLEEIINEFSSFVQRVWDFASSVAIQVLQFIKDSLLNWLRQHASSIRGYRLMTVLIEKDPVTDERVERTAQNTLSGFVELVAGPEKFQQIEQSGAIERLATWLNGVTARLGISFQMIRDLFVDIWNSFSVQDLIHPLEAFARVLDRFGEKISRVIAFVIEVIKKIIEIMLEIMQVPIDVGRQIVQRVMAAYETIKRDPAGFFINLLRAIKLGFEQFFGKIGQYLLQGLTGWLFAELETAGIRPPQDLSLRSIIGFVMEILGISIERIWQKLAEHPSIGPARVARLRGMISQLTGIWTIIQEVMTEGPGALWRHLQEQLSNLWDTLLDSVKNWVMERIVNQMIARLLSMLDPSGIMAVVNSVIAMYRAVQSFIERLREIMNIINSFVGGILEIANGNVGPAANYLERTMASAMPTMIGFLANQIGLRGVGRQIGDMVGRVREMVDRGLTWLVERMVRMGQRLLQMGRNAASRLMSGLRDLLSMNEGFTTEDSGERHTLFFEETGENNVELFVQSQKILIRNLLSSKRQEFIALPEGAAKTRKLNALSRVESRLQEINNLKRILALESGTGESREQRREVRAVRQKFNEFLADLAIIGVSRANSDSELPESNVQIRMENGKAKRVLAQPLSKKQGNKAGSAPFEKPKGWEVIESIPGYDSKYVRLHLLNDWLHGPGEKGNLTPGRKTENSYMLHNSETPAYNLVEQNRVLWYEVIISGYRSESGLRDFATNIIVKFGFMEKNNAGNWVKVGGLEHERTYEVSRPDEL